MKRIILSMIMLTVLVYGCSTIQSIVKSTFPYTSTLIIPANSKINTTLSATSPASSFDQVFIGQGNNASQVSQVRVASVKLDASNPSTQSLGILKSVNIYLVNNDGETLVATRTDIAPTIGSSIMLDIDNSKFLDDYLKNGNVRVRMQYVLRSNITMDLSVKASIGFNAAPAAK
jgi:hypothetical protein